MSDFDKAIGVILAVEGGYVSAADALARKDPGGETKYGISKRQYPDLDIAALTLEDAKAIYRRDYWDKVRGDQVPWPLNLFLFDAAVNQGVEATVRMLQKAIDLPQDGIFGVGTLSKVLKLRPFHYSKFMATRALRYTGTRNFDVNGLGWLIRLFEVSRAATKDGD